MRSLVIIAPLLACAAVAQAQELKIGYVDMGRALNDVEDGKAAKARLKADFDDKQKKLDAMQADLKAKKDELDKKASMMKPDVKKAKEDEFQRNLMELQQTFMQLQKELMERESQLTQEIAGKLRTIITKVGDRDGYGMILDIGETVLYYKRHLDITLQVVQEYNRQYGANGAPAGKK